MTAPIVDVYGIFEAGKKIYGENFKFLSNDQQYLTTNVLLSSKKFHALQAETAFGKTLTYALPILTLHRSAPGGFVHFLAVPYQSLKVTAIKKLENFNLKAADINVLRGEDVTNKIAGVNILVGCFDSFVSRGLKETFANWRHLFGQMQKGYIIFDEAHVLWTEKKFRNNLSNISGLDWKSFLKVIMLSATLPKWLIENIVKERNIPLNLLENGSCINVVKKVPNENIRTVIEKCPKRFFDNKVRDIIVRYLSNTTQEKAVFVFFANKKVTGVYPILIFMTTKKSLWLMQM